MSAIWKYFQVNEDDKSKAVCKICKSKLSRGGTNPNSYNTSNLIKHLKTQHDAEHKEFSHGGGKLQQQTLPQTLKKWEKMSRDNPHAMKITEALTQYIALDDQPLSVVENIGFRRLLSVLEPRYEIPSRQYITDRELPKLYDFVKRHIQSLLQDVSAISLTTDIWTSSVSPVSLISLTAQWVDKDFTLQRAVLHAKHFRGSHTSQAIADVFDEMLRKWGVSKTLIHVVLRDNAKNMIKAMTDAGLQSLPCFAHTLQLVVNEGLLVQRSVTDAVAIGRKIVRHFKHSTLAYSRLEDIQLQLNQPTKRLQQDVQTRWNSTFYMLQSLIEQKRALGIYGSEHELPENLAAHQWALLEKTVAVLAPFEEFTRKVSRSDALASDVIPAVTVLLRILNRETEEDQGIKTMKSTLAAAVKRRFTDTEKIPLYCIATLLDPRYKDRFFSNVNIAMQAKQMLKVELQSVNTGEPKENLEEPPAKRLCMTQASSSLDRVFEEITEEQKSSSQSHATPVGAAIQLETYLGETTIAREENPLQFWGVNKMRFPALAKISQRYLSAPCTSVESERLFSSVSHIINEDRNRLSAANAEMLLFLKKNLPLTFLK